MVNNLCCRVNVSTWPNFQREKSNCYGKRPILLGKWPKIEGKKHKL